MDSKLQQIWAAQVQFNKAVRGPRPDEDDWMEKYLLGINSEVSEVLEEINWKAHRKGHPVNRKNLGRELADVTKYLLSAWELAGFQPEEMLELVEQKTEEMNLRWQQEFKHIQPGSRVVICDLDGTLADYRGSFISWLKQHEPQLPPDPSLNFAMEIDLGLDFLAYERYKEQFEAEGGYAKLQPYPGAVNFLQLLKIRDRVEIVVCTARPQQKMSHIWQDTWNWLKGHSVHPLIHSLHTESSEARLFRATTLQREGCSVVLVDDDPTTALRAAHAGVPVVLREQPYNENVSHPLIFREPTLRTELVGELLRSQQERRK